ncbi:hypothetical protein AAMO2058_001498600 [Amorphochlora amoebiformis]
MRLNLVFFPVALGWFFSSAASVPKIEVGGRVVDLFNGEHFDDVLMDTPDALRPGGIVVFYRTEDSTCNKKFKALKLKYNAEKVLPSRERVFIGKYNIDFQDKRLHTEFSPEQDLPKRFGLDDKVCPTIVYIPQKCNGHTQWCTKDAGKIQLVGCEDFVEQCEGWRIWDGEGDWVKWAMEQIESEPYPPLDDAFKSYASQDRWIKGRDTVTTNTHLRNNFLGVSLPRFSDTGTKLIKIPDNLYKELTDFYYKNIPVRSNEPWDIYGATQMNFHEVGTDLVYLDLDPIFRDRIANQHIKPILEEWSGQKLKLNAFYGIREYFPGAWLRNHIDRIDTHIISATLSLLKINATTPWPLETVRWDGKRVRFEHKAGEMILYESSTRPHGRPYKLVDGMHVGCFVHFSPIDESTFRPYLQTGRGYQSRNSTRVRYDENVSLRPSEPERTVSVIVTPENMVEKSLDRRERKVDPKPKKRKRNRTPTDLDQMSVDFVNDLSKDLILYWVDHQNKAVENAFLDPMNKVQINTYKSHRFFFAYPSAKKPDVPSNGVLTVKDGMSVVKASEMLGAQQAHVDL